MMTWGDFVPFNCERCNVELDNIVRYNSVVSVNLYPYCDFCRRIKILGDPNSSNLMKNLALNQGYTSIPIEERRAQLIKRGLI